MGIISDPITNPPLPQVTQFQVEEAISIITYSRQTHSDYIEREPYATDKEHHLEWIKRYTTIIQVLEVYSDYLKHEIYYEEMISNDIEGIINFRIAVKASTAYIIEDISLHEILIKKADKGEEVIGGRQIHVECVEKFSRVKTVLNDLARVVGVHG